MENWKRKGFLVLFTPAFGHPFYIEGELLPFLVVIQLYKDEQQRSEAPQRRATVADERQGYANNWHQPDGHPDVDGQVEEDDGGHTIAIYPREGIALFFCHNNQAYDEGKIECDKERTSDKAPFFADATEDEVGTLLRHEVQLCLCAVQVAFSEKSAGTDGNFRLVQVEVSPFGVNTLSQNGVYALPLVRLKDFVVGKINSKDKKNK